MAIEFNNISSLYPLYGQTRPYSSQAANPGQPEDDKGIQDRVTLSEKAKKVQGGPKTEENLSTEEKQQVNELKKIDTQVKAHEQAHMAAGAGIVQGGASYQYQVGPDGKRYAVGGEVSIDVSPERTPEATIRKMQQVKSAAMAPAQPSGTDRAVAARAAQTEAKARAEKAEQDQKAMEDDSTEDPMASPIEQSVNERKQTEKSDEKPSSTTSRDETFAIRKPAYNAIQNQFKTKGLQINLVV